MNQREKNSQKFKGTLFSRNHFGLSSDNLPTNQVPGEMDHLPSLEILIKQINTEIFSIKRQKREVLRKLVLIYNNREFYFLNSPEYKNDFSKFIEDNIDQDRSTTLDDIKIIKLLSEKGKEGLLEKDINDMVYILKRIAQLSQNKNCSELTTSLQTRLLGLMEEGELNRKRLKEEIETTNPKSSDKPKYIFSESSNVRVKYDKSKKTIYLKAESIDLLDKLSVLINSIDEKNIETILSSLNETN